MNQKDADSHGLAGVLARLAGERTKDTGQVEVPYAVVERATS